MIDNYILYLDGPSIRLDRPTLPCTVNKLTYRLKLTLPLRLKRPGTSCVPRLWMSSNFDRCGNNCCVTAASSVIDCCGGVDGCPFFALSVSYTICAAHGDYNHTIPYRDGTTIAAAVVPHLLLQLVVVSLDHGEHARSTARSPGMLYSVQHNPPQQ